MTRIDPVELSTIILTPPAWARVGITMPDIEMREKAAAELALTIVERLSDFPAIPDYNQLHFPSNAMRIPTPDLTRKALLALEEMVQTHGGSFPRNMALRFILAYLYSVSNSPRDREPFDEFWRGNNYTHPHSKEMNAIYHHQERTRLMKGIYNAVGHRRR